jgi:hypothetical protein
VVVDGAVVVVVVVVVVVAAAVMAVVVVAVVVVEVVPWHMGTMSPLPVVSDVLLLKCWSPDPQ